MLEELKKKVYEANMELPRRGLITYTWGNVSGIDRDTGYFVIKPSGVDYDKLRPEDMVVMDLEGNRIEGTLNPSSDTPTHLELYKKYPEIGGVVHTHSPEATSWAQAGRDIPLYGTTHADYFYGPIPCARSLTPEEIGGEYERNTGLVIIETFEQRGLNPMHTPGVLCTNHGPFTWARMLLKQCIMRLCWRRLRAWRSEQNYSTLRYSRHRIVFVTSIFLENMEKMHTMVNSMM